MEAGVALKKPAWDTHAHPRGAVSESHLCFPFLLSVNAHPWKPLVTVPWGSLPLTWQTQAGFQAPGLAWSRTNCCVHLSLNAFQIK